MATTTTVGPTSDQNINGLIQGSKWSGVITYNFPESFNLYPVGYSAHAGFAQVGAPLQTVIEWALFQQFAAVSNIQFQYSGSNKNTAADMAFARYNGGAHAMYPDGGGDVWLGLEFANSVRGTSQWMNVMHEIGHAIGFKHAHEVYQDDKKTILWPNGAISDDKNSLEFSLMTYFAYIDKPDTENSAPETYGYPQSLMMYDIAALQYFYGPNYTTHSGRTTYRWDPLTGEMFIREGAGPEQAQGKPGDGAPGANKIFMTIWDGGGEDTYDLSGYTANGVMIDLNPGGYTITSDAQRAILKAGDPGGYHTARGNIFNALLYADNPASLIENAIGGTQNDTIIGNAANNVLRGGPGADTMDGKDGSDTVDYTGSSAGVTVNIQTNTASGGDAQGDILSNFENIKGSSHDDTLTGRANGSVIRGGLGGDKITGGAGNDHLYGADSNLVVNGGFEVVASPVIRENGYVEYVSLMDGWTLLSGPGLELFTAGVAEADPFEGKFAADLEGYAPGTNVSISQQLVRAEEGVWYRLAFEARKLTASVNARLEVSWGGDKLTFGGGHTYMDPTDSYLTYYIDLLGGSGDGQNRLTFTEIGGGDGNGTLLDNVRMYRVDPGIAKANDDDPYNDGNDVFYPGTGSDVVFGHGGNDIVYFTDPNEIVGEDDDHFDGGAGIDTLVMDWSATALPITHGALGALNSPEIGVAEYYREGDQYLFFKEVERFELKGGSKADTLIGGELNDILIGNGGDDTLVGGGGIDVLDGGPGFDRAVIRLSGGNNTIRMSDIQGGGSVTLADGTKLISIEAVDLTGGDGDDFLDVRGTIVNAPGLPYSDWARTDTSFMGYGGNDTLAVDFATSYGASFDGGAGTGDLLIMDWSAAKFPIFRDAGDGAYKSYSHTITYVDGQGHQFTTEYFYTVSFSNVERFDLTGGSANDALFGGAGDDRLNGGTGSDTVTAGAGFDTLVVNWAGVTNYRTQSAPLTGSLLNGYSGFYNNDFNDPGRNQVSFSGIERFDVTTGAGSDSFFTGDGDDIVSTGDGDDFLNSGKGADIVNGGAGNADRWQANKSDATVAININLASLSNYVVGGHNGSVQGFEVLGGSNADGDRFSTGAGNDVIVTLGLFLNDYIETNGGNDTVTVAGGSDVVLMGGQAVGGSDTLIVNWANVTNYKTITGEFTGTLATGYSGFYNNDFNDPGRNQLRFAGVERFNVSTGSGDDTVTTGDGDDIVSTGAGDDTLITGTGADVIDGGAGIDRWISDKSALTVAQPFIMNLRDLVTPATYGGGGSVTGIEVLTLITGAGDDNITTLKTFLNDQVTTGAGADRVVIGGGSDTVSMGPGFDTLVVEWDAVTTYKTQSAPLTGSLLNGYSGFYNNDFNDPGRNQVSFSGVERFEVSTGAGNDSFFTGDGDDIVSTGGGDDFLNSGKGADIVNGGVGNADRWQADKSDATAAISINLASLSNYVVGGHNGSVQGFEALGGSNADGDRFSTGAGNDVIVTLGLFLNDYIETNGGNDTVTVAGGSDVVLMGGQAVGGSDTLIVNWANVTNYKTITGEFTGTLATGYSGFYNNDFNDPGRNQLRFAGVERFNVSTGSGDDTVTTGDGDDIVSTGAGDDTLITGTGADVIDGGAGIDRWISDKSALTAAQPFIMNLRDLVTPATYGAGGSVTGIEVLTLTTGAGDDNITTLKVFLNDQVTTGAGADRVVIGGGSDTVSMGPGFDTLVVEWDAVTDYRTQSAPLTGSLLNGYSGFYNNDFNDPGRNQVSFTGVERFEVSTGAGNDSFFTGDGDDIVSTGGGDDFLNSGKGADIVNGGAGNADRWQADKSDATVAININLASLSNYVVGGHNGSVQGFEALGGSNADGDRFSTGAGNDVIVTLGLFLNDYIETNGGNDTVTVAGGSDVVLMGGQAVGGSDTLIVNWANVTNYQTITGEFTGTLATGYSGFYNNNFNDPGRNQLRFAGVERFNVSTGSGDDTVTTGDGDDTVSTGAGSDLLRTGKGADIINGGLGDDRWQADKSDATAAININLSAMSNYVVGGNTGSVQGIEALGVGNAAGDRFSTGSGNDVIVTLSGFYNDYIETNGGNDTVTVAGGSDVVLMGDQLANGSDTLIVNWAGITGYSIGTSEFTGTLDAGYSGFYNNNFNDPGRNQLRFAGVEKFAITTGNGNDSIVTGDGDDTVTGGAGDDFLRTGKGADVVDGSADNDRWQADKSDATAAINIDLSVISNYVVGGKTGSVQGIEALGAGNATGERFSTGGGNDVLVTLSGFYNDYIETNGGNDTVTVAGGSDVVMMGTQAAGGADTLVVNWASVAGYSVNASELTADAAGYSGFYNNNFNDPGRNQLQFSGVERFDVTTGNGNDTIITGAGDDIIRTGAGDDTLRGGAGHDLLEGGAGNDRFVFADVALTDGQSQIFDQVLDYRQGNSSVFDGSEDDRLDLSGILAAAFGGGQPVSSLVRLVEDTSLKFSKLQVDGDGAANGVQWTTIAQLDGIHTSHTANVVMGGANVTVGVQASIGNYTDFGGEGRSDLLWRSDTGGLAIWNMNGGAVTGANDLGIVDSSWTVFGTGDFNGDGKGDMVWRHDGGALALWQMNGGSVSAVADLGLISDAWQIIGVGDFNGDAKSDLLWRDVNGFTALWVMNGGSVTAVGSLGIVDASWHVIGLADVNGDAKSDMIWRDDAGFLAVWEMDGGVVTAVDSLGVISNDWHIVGSGDFNGDTKSDLVWRNDAGALVIWEMNGGVVTAVDNLGLIGDNWHIAGVGDFNADGKADLMWNSDAGAAALWLMDGGTVTAVGDLGNIGQNWTTLNHHYDFV